MSLIVGMILRLKILIISFSNLQPLNLQAKIHNIRLHFHPSKLNFRKQLKESNHSIVFLSPTFMDHSNKIFLQVRKGVSNNHQIQNSNNKYFRNALDTQAALLNISVLIATLVFASSACLLIIMDTGQLKWRKPFK